MKTGLRNHLYYHWWVYVMSAALIVALWLSVFDRLAQPKANEQINITYIGGSFDHLKLQSDLYDVLPERTQQNIKRISVENAVIEGEYDLNTILRARTAGSCDFFIIESSVIGQYEMDLSSYFPEADASALETLVEDVEYIAEGGKVYGLSCTGGMTLASYYSGKNECMIFFNKHSVNLSDLFGGNEKQDAALQIIRFLTEAKDVQT